MTISGERLKLKRRLLTIEEYDRMGEVGILHEDEHVELIEGELIQMAAIGGQHSACVSRLDDVFHARLPATAAVRIQDPIRLPPRTEPEPDVVIVHRRADYYATAHPGPDDILLIVEVADSSLPYDREIKLSLYAAAGIPEVWIADVQGRRVLAHRLPEGDTYRETRIIDQGSLAPSAFPELTIRLAEIFG